MNWLLSIAYRNARKLLQLKFQIAPLLQNINKFGQKMYSRQTSGGKTSKFNSLHKQLGFLRSRALDNRKDIDAKIAELQKRIERIRKQLKDAASKRAEKSKKANKDSKEVFSSKKES